MQWLVHVAEFVVCRRRPQLVGVDGIEMGRVHRILDFGYVRGRYTTHALLEIDAREKWMLFDLVRVLTQATIGARAQL